MLSEIDDQAHGSPQEPPSDPLAAVLRPVRAGNAFEETVERLLQIIKLGVVAHGERLPPERELAPRLGVSRVTLREAIRALQQEGYVESRRGRSGGTFVIYRTPRPQSGDLARVAEGQVEKLTDALTYRMAVETGAAQLLADMRLNETQTARLRRALEEANNADEADYRRLDARFHLTIAELTGSTLLSAACADARMRVTDLLNAIPVLKRNIEHSAQQHEAIVAAILEGDPEAARIAVVEHLEGTAALLRGFLT
ncbi:MULTISPECIES: FadR/GntR family transcriptional regulator [Thermomonospora]|uniref:GntR domain protein n=1 Tax=Thermomonospora curvata (strain ATCC 19995 / DSM 43183 / JCM 3096 / KCTC 9072 / NBRC 15933 / NCIMB 10081 / Henssen B9) TaxID=471852 RepID=D1AD64_THECD|nr:MULTISPECIES: FCD domain-containing protein [Thermomonospora]ACY99373.1 GntR domain protein [Thermomonospora curvata DSM 43183]PKK12422.1 MAG: FadR family transcriptional regulator [Thermomonospora sp. CIF 1]